MDEDDTVILQEPRKLCVVVTAIAKSIVPSGFPCLPSETVINLVPGRKSKQ